MAKRLIYVYADWTEVAGPLLMGYLSSEMLRGKEIFSFTYDKEWLSSPFAQVLDPDLQLYQGPQYLTDENKYNFGMFLDSSPDRWGRVLMQRREAAKARQQQRKPNTLFETDYLLGVYDGHRMGGLRFKLEPNGPFLDNDEQKASPPQASVRELEQISLRLEDEDAFEHPDYQKWLKMLVNPGSSLGGARPKASVSDAKKRLWIAKFPSKNDGYDVGAWEMVAYTLACEAGIHMAECKVAKFTSNHHTFMAKRFDRTLEGSRIHFTSAMTQLGYTDGADAASGVSYLDLAEFISGNCYNPEKDLHELWKRIVFSICISNTDDHLRNHGFLLSDKGWHLSPAFDINPVETGAGLSLNITENDNSLAPDLAMEVHEYFRLDKNEASTIMKQVMDVVRNWREVAAKYGIPKSQSEIKAAAFRAVN